MTCLEKGIRLLRGSYYNDRPEGFISLEREDGSWTEGFCLDGVWDGLVREFDSDRNIKVRGDCWQGRSTVFRSLPVKQPALTFPSGPGSRGESK